MPASKGEDNRRTPGDWACTGSRCRFFSTRRLYTGMLSFYEYLAQSRKMSLPDTHTMLATAGVPLGFPDEEETLRLLNRDRKRQPVGGKAHKGIIALDSRPARTASKLY